MVVNMSNKGKKYRSYKRLTIEKKELIFQMYEKKVDLREIARTMDVHLRTVQYQIQKRLKELEDVS